MPGEGSFNLTAFLGAPLVVQGLCLFTVWLIVNCNTCFQECLCACVCVCLVFVHYGGKYNLYVRFCQSDGTFNTHIIVLLLLFHVRLVKILMCVCLLLE